MMKCVCGYEYKEEGPFGKRKIIAGDEPFVDMGTKATIETGDYHKTQEDVSLWICPKCGTVRAGGWRFQRHEKEA